MASKEIVIEGHCACHATTWTSTAAPSHLDFCYCTECQQVTGAPFGAWVGVPTSDVKWSNTRGFFRLSSLATRSFCKTCGSTLSIQYECYPQKVHIAVGTVVKGQVPKMACHLFVSEKPSWYTIPDDGVRRWERFDDEFQDVMKRWKENTGP